MGLSLSTEAVIIIAGLSVIAFVLVVGLAVLGTSLWRHRHDEAARSQRHARRVQDDERRLCHAPAPRPGAVFADEVHSQKAIDFTLRHDHVQLELHCAAGDVHCVGSELPAYHSQFYSSRAPLHPEENGPNCLKTTSTIDEGNHGKVAASSSASIRKVIQMEPHSGEASSALETEAERAPPTSKHGEITLGASDPVPRPAPLRRRLVSPNVAELQSRGVLPPQTPPHGDEADTNLPPVEVSVVMVSMERVPSPTADREPPTSLPEPSSSPRREVPQNVASEAVPSCSENMLDGAETDVRHQRACRFCGANLRDPQLLESQCARFPTTFSNVTRSHAVIANQMKLVKKEKKRIQEMLAQGNLHEGQSHLDKLQRDFPEYLL